MKYKNYVSTFTLCIFFAFLIGCSHNGAFTRYGSKASQAYGLSNQQGYLLDKSSIEYYSTKAPENQVYLFAFDSNVVANKYYPAIEAQARYLKSHPRARVLLAGHTDIFGSREYNIALGERRAKAVRDILRLSGVNSRQIRVVSYGKEKLALVGNNESSHRQNRRVELIYEGK